MSGSGPKRPRAGRGPSRAGQRPRSSGTAPAEGKPGETPWSSRRQQEEIAKPSQGAAGRKIQHSTPAQPTAPPAPAQQSPSNTRPFAHYRLGADARRYVAGDGGAATSGAFASVVTAVVSLASVSLCVVAVFGLYSIWTAYQQGPEQGTVAQAEAVQRRTIDDSKLMNQRRAGKAAAAAKAQPAPVSMNVPSGVYFHELEVRCEETGFRSRGRFYGGRATVLSVPPETLCWARFMGSEQARWPVYAGQTFDCSFDPVRCVER